MWFKNASSQQNKCLQAEIELIFQLERKLRKSRFYVTQFYIVNVPYNMRVCY